MDFSDWLYLAVKSGKGLTAREIRGKKKHKILWCFGDLKGVYCGGQCPFCLGLYLGKEVLCLLSHISILIFLLQKTLLVFLDFLLLPTLPKKNL